MRRSEAPGSRLLRGRSAVLRVVLVLGLAVVVARLWQLQVVEGSALYSAALGESRRVVSIPAPRGKILSRDGVVLATDVPRFAAELTATGGPPSAAELALLQRILGVAPAKVRAAAAQLAGGANVAPVVLRSGLNAEQYTLLVENRPALPGVQVVPLQLRVYPGLPGAADPGQELAANILGFVQDGVQGDVTGAAGVEKSYNGPLQLPGGGTTPGLQGIDGRGFLSVGRNGAIHEQGLVPPVPGDNVVLTIDAKLQAMVQRALSDQMAALRTRSFSGEGGPYPDAYAGAVVVIDVRNGQILAAASEPTFNPNAFAAATGARQGSAADAAFAAQYQAWLNQPGSPLINHVVSDVAPPGSTFKPITAIAALEQGTITAAQRIACPAFIQLAPGYVLHNWIPAFDGYLNLTEAIAQSCDTYFYTVGAKTGIGAIDRVAAAFGLGQLTGQGSLYGEDPGQVSGPAVEPPGEGPWTPALTMQSAIGQAFSDFNPLEVADYVAALANGGTLWRPYFVREVVAPDGQVLIHHHPEVRRRIPLTPSIVQAIHNAMAAVTQINPAWYQDGVTSDWGTAYWPFYNFTAETAQYLGRSISVAGKTGTAQVVPGQTSDGWFISFAPVSHPQIAVVVFVHHANEGFASGAPVVREIYNYYFGLDKAMWRAGVSADIVPPAVQGYFGMARQIPQWWPAAPPAAGAGGGSTASTAAAPAKTAATATAGVTQAPGAGGASSASSAPSSSAAATGPIATAGTAPASTGAVPAKTAATGTAGAAQAPTAGGAPAVTGAATAATTAPAATAEAPAAGGASTVSSSSAAATGPTGTPGTAQPPAAGGASPASSAATASTASSAATASNGTAGRAQAPAPGGASTVTSAAYGAGPPPGTG